MKIFVFNFPEDCAIVVNIKTNTTSYQTAHTFKVQRTGPWPTDINNDDDEYLYNYLL